jgi:hypothetical protein
LCADFRELTDEREFSGMKVGIALRDLSHTNYNKRVLSVLRYLLKM